MLFRKPPLIEMWMSFHFEPAAGMPVWDRTRYTAFLNAVASDYPKSEEKSRQAVRVSRSKRGRGAQVEDILDQILAVRAFSEDGLRAIQLTPDELVVNFVRAGLETYPGFDLLLDVALAHHNRYSELYRPPGVIEVAIHYANYINIPVPEDGLIRSEDYFTLNFQVPADFGAFAAFQVIAQVLPPDAHEPIEVIFATSSKQKEDTCRGFRLEFHAASRTGSRMLDKDVRECLQIAHDRIQNCFRHAFTPAGLALFEPFESP